MHIVGHSEYPRSDGGAVYITQYMQLLVFANVYEEIYYQVLASAKYRMVWM